MISAKWLVCFSLSVCLLPAVPGLAQDDDMPMHHHDAGEQLGKVSFPISCSPASQKDFERGVALMHSFEYEQAQAQFTAITKSDPSCAMAHWGIAMSLFHQIWERPQPATLQQGHDEIVIAQKLAAKTDREQGYIAALAIFYADPASKDYLKHATAYSAAMGKLYAKYPNDTEAGAFYALSLLASEPPDDPTLANRKKAVAVLLPLFQRDPDHPDHDKRDTR